GDGGGRRRGVGSGPAWAPPPGGGAPAGAGPHADAANWVAVSPDGRETVVAIENRLLLHATASGRLARELPPFRGVVRSVAWAGDVLLVSLFYARAAHLVSAVDGREARRLEVAGEGAGGPGGGGRGRGWRSGARRVVGRRRERARRDRGVRSRRRRTAPAARRLESGRRRGGLHGRSAGVGERGRGRAHVGHRSGHGR